MKQLKASGSTLFFNNRDELTRISLDRIALFEADSNYCHVTMISGAKITILSSLVNIERIIDECKNMDNSFDFVRVGKKYIVNRQYIFHINIPRQKLIMTDWSTRDMVNITMGKESLRTLKRLCTP